MANVCIEVPDGKYCWEFGKVNLHNRICDYFDNDGGGANCMIFHCRLCRVVDDDGRELGYQKLDDCISATEKDLLYG